MRKTVTAALFILALPALALAMPQGEQRGHGHHGSHYAKELNLTREQSREVRQAMAEQMKANKEITQRYLDKLPAADQQAMQNELKAAKDKHHSAVRAVLNPEQQKMLDEQQKKIQERRAEREEFKAWKAEKEQKAE